MEQSLYIGLVTYQANFKNGSTNDFVRFCTFGLVTKQELHELTAAVILCGSFSEIPWQQLHYIYSLGCLKDKRSLALRVLRLVREISIFTKIILPKKIHDQTTLMYLTHHNNLSAAPFVL